MKRTGGLFAAVVTVGAAMVVATPTAGASTVGGGGSAIQQAIDAAAPGAVIYVEAGTYGPIDFGGKDVEVRSLAGPASTVIDAGGSGTAVTFDGGETRAAVLSGFTVTGGWEPYQGAGIHIASSSPTIVGNVIEDNVGCSGAGIRSSFGSPRIEGNVIRGNTSAPTGWSGCRGGGVYIGGASAAELVGNQILGNHADAGGGGVTLNAAGDPLVARNVISGNDAARGGGLESANANHGRFEQNVIRGNHADAEGGAIHWTGPSGDHAFRFANNTVVANTSGGDADGAVFTYFLQGASFVNNVFAVTAGDAFTCGYPYPAQTPATFTANALYAGPGADPVSTSCAVSRFEDGNQVADPMVDTTGAPVEGSPLVDTGAAVSLAHAVDVVGAARIVDGDGNGSAAIDRGAFERAEVTVTVPSAPQGLAAGFTKRQQARVTWSAPADDGGSPVTGYELVVVETGERQLLPASARSATISGVRDTQSYEIRLRASNSVGAGAPAVVTLEASGDGGQNCHPKRGC